MKWMVLGVAVLALVGTPRECFAFRHKGHSAFKTQNGPSYNAVKGYYLEEEPKTVVEKKAQETALNEWVNDTKGMVTLGPVKLG